MISVVSEVSWGGAKKQCWMISPRALPRTGPSEPDSRSSLKPCTHLRAKLSLIWIPLTCPLQLHLHFPTQMPLVLLNRLGSGAGRGGRRVEVAEVSEDAEIQ